MQGFLIPLEQSCNSFLNLDLMSPTEGVEFGYIDEFAHGAIRLGGIEFYRSLETNSFHDELGEFTDGQFLTSSYVDVAAADLA